MKHTWQKLEDSNEIDRYAMSASNCNGPVCERCGFSFCEQCTPERYDDDTCPSDEELIKVRAKQYQNKVLDALKDDGKTSLSFKDIDSLTHDEIIQILPIAVAYGGWLTAVRDKAYTLYGEETVFFEKALDIEKLFKDTNSLCEKLGI